jgi:hypothetical protein
MTNRRVLQIFLMALVLTSTTMLSVSISHLHLIPLTVVAIVGAFCMTDLLQWISVKGWIANVLSLGILFYSMFEFYPADSAGKLIAVSKLLVYLQAVLLFQEKTPRLNWQIMVLSLLQVVITTIFSVGFEGSILFSVFFIVGAITLVLQNAFSNECMLEQRNESSADTCQRIDSEKSPVRRLAFWRHDPRPAPKITSLESLQKFRIRPLAILPGVLFVATLFSLFLFLTAPRNPEPWFSPITYKVQSAGFTKEMNLEETGKVNGSNRNMFEAKFTSNDNDSEPIRLGELPYFRGIALSNLTFKDGKTSWNAAYERISSNTYQAIQNVRIDVGNRLAVMQVTMEKSAEPMLYTPMPAGIARNTSGKLKFCHEISAFTRCRENEKVDFAPFGYELMIPLDGKNNPAKAWPYVANTKRYSNNPMSDDPAQQRWLTRMDRKNYPTLVKIADSIAEKVRSNGGGRVELVREIENHFLNPSTYSYTLDYTNVNRNLNIDPNEDFVANFKTGHCEAFASAMTLMLRSQGIPARLVTGFLGGEFNEFSESYVVRGSHAHAWVEVYLRRRDCRLAKLEPWQYKEGGAWLTADPTPPQPAIESGLRTDDAIEMARTVWQDYVLGMEADQGSEETSLTATVVEFFDNFEFDKLSDRFAESRQYGLIAILQPVLFLILILACIVGMLRVLIVNAGYEEDQPDTAVGRIKRFFADAIGLISSDLREWVIGQGADVAFYRRLTAILEGHNHVRSPEQTHREFANEVSSKYLSHPSSGLISAVLKDVTESFNRIRFGLHEIDDNERSEIDNRIEELDRILKIGSAQ